MTGLPNRREFLTADNGQPAKPLPERTTHLEVLMVDIHRFTRIGSRESMRPASTPPDQGGSRHGDADSALRVEQLIAAETQVRHA